LKKADVIIFDLDETLIRTLKRQYYVIHKFLNKYSVSPKFQFEEYCEIRKDKLYSNFQFYELYNLDPLLNNDFRSFFKDEIEKFENLIIDDLIIDFNVFNSFQEINNYIFILLSLRQNHTNSFKQIEFLKLNNYFSEIIFVSHQKDKNPKTEKIIYLSEKYNVRYFVGDSISDQEAVLNTQVQFIKVNTGLYDFEYSGLQFDNVNQLLNQF
jgi:phosphoglycolate phosphatase-like HAD superfamily hydrolase